MQWFAVLKYGEGTIKNFLPPNKNPRNVNKDKLGGEGWITFIPHITHPKPFFTIFNLSAPHQNPQTIKTIIISLINEILHVIM